MSRLSDWYLEHGRHLLPWRQTRDRWHVLVSEVMLHQTQAARVADRWPDFIAEFPDPETMAGAGSGAVIKAWGRLGYPRRARRLWESAVVIAKEGWPDDLRDLPGVGRYTAAAVRAQADDVDLSAIEVNIRRVVERVVGRRLSERDAERESVRLAPGLHGRERLLALMDVGALVCRPREPRCSDCPLRSRCATRGVLADETRARQAPFEGSFRQRRGRVLAALRNGQCNVADLDEEALVSLALDGLADIDRGLARLPQTTTARKFDSSV